ncbi:MAG: NADH:ubiquinone reductase (Na(+)-transporting) subunit A [Candidatus Algichlamydia australiensis]|nr:NADH:ubiquinone reductase (Na(+)-transporting) subunit A [Chlamydiales bacterium]
MHIKIRKGLTIPLPGPANRFIEKLTQPKRAALELSSFKDVRFALKVQEGDLVQIGTPLVVDKDLPERNFVSPVSGKVVEIKRGEKRRLLAIGIELDSEQQSASLPKITNGDRDAIIKSFLQAGLFAHIRQRPCNILAHPKRLPKSIFVQALASAPYEPSPLLEMEEYRQAFAKGLELLEKIAPVHVVSREKLDLQHGTNHTAEGPHPIANPSVHIYHIDPITNREQTVWTVQVHDVIVMGILALEGRYHNTRLISLAGEPVPEEKRGFYRVTCGTQIQEIFQNRECRIISGNPLTGRGVQPDDYLGFFDSTICAIQESHKRRLLHFLRAKTKSYSALKAYLTSKQAQFSTLQHGEERAFVDGGIYQKIMPMEISVMHLIKALLAENLELADELGLLEVAAEDFALSEFICPSKVPMCAIAEKGLLAYAKQYF